MGLIEELPMNQLVVRCYIFLNLPSTQDSMKSVLGNQYDSTNTTSKHVQEVGDDRHQPNDCGEHP